MFKNIKNKGYTLAEIMVVVAILGFIVIAMTSFQRNVLVYNKYSMDTLNTAQSAKSIIKTMVKDLRITSQGSDGSYAISQAATNTLTFYSDTDGDGLRERIRYYISGTSTLMRESIVPSGNPLVYGTVQHTYSTLAYDVKNSTSTALFEYYDENYAGTSSPMTLPIDVYKIRLVKINLIIDVDVNRSPTPILYTSQVGLRNLKDNL